jgi:hypothetical protein
LVAGGVEPRRDSATTGLGKRGYQSLGARLLLMSRGQLAHREVVDDEDVGSDEFADPFLPGAAA